MAAKFQDADLEAYALLKGQIDLHHKELAAVGISIDLIFAYGARNADGEKTGPALQKSGYPCNGIASIVSLKDRVMGRRDAEICVDGDSWPTMEDGERNALLDHELQHFTVARDVEGEPIRDSHGRCKLKMVKHDWQFGWFDAVAARHKEFSVEVTQAKQIVKEAGQVYFPFLKSVPKTAKGVKAKALKEKPAPEAAGSENEAS